jgi:hypothetical protein
MIPVASAPKMVRPQSGERCPLNSCRLTRLFV